MKETCLFFASLFKKKKKKFSGKGLILNSGEKFILLRMVINFDTDEIGTVPFFASNNKYVDCFNNFFAGKETSYQTPIFRPCAIFNRRACLQANFVILELNLLPNLKQVKDLKAGQDRNKIIQRVNV